MRQLVDFGESKHAEDKQNGPKSNIHVVGNQVDDAVEYLAILVKNHKRNGEQKADRSRVDGEASEDDSHADLGFEALLEDLRIGGELDQVLLFENLLHHERVRRYDQ